MGVNRHGDVEVVKRKYSVVFQLTENGFGSMPEDSFLTTTKRVCIVVNPCLISSDLAFCSTDLMFLFYP